MLFALFFLFFDAGFAAYDFDRYVTTHNPLMLALGVFMGILAFLQLGFVLKS